MFIQAKGNCTVTLKDSAGNGTWASNSTLGVAYGGATIKIESGNYSSGDTAFWAGGADETGNIIVNNGTITGQEFAIGVGKDSVATINNGKLIARDNAVVGGNGSQGKYENATININGGELEGHIQTAGYTGCGVYMPNSGTVNISGGKFTIDGVGVCARAGKINITGGEFISTVSTAG